MYLQPATLDHERVGELDLCESLGLPESEESFTERGVWLLLGWHGKKQSKPFSFEKHCCDRMEMLAMRLRLSVLVAALSTGELNMVFRPQPPSSRIDDLAATARRHRLPLGASLVRISYERRLRLWLVVLLLASIMLLGSFVYRQTGSMALSITSVLAFALV